MTPTISLTLILVRWNWPHAFTFTQNVLPCLLGTLVALVCKLTDSFLPFFPSCRNFTKLLTGVLNWMHIGGHLIYQRNPNLNTFSNVMKTFKILKWRNRRRTKRFFVYIDCHQMTERLTWYILLTCGSRNMTSIPGLTFCDYNKSKRTSQILQMLRPTSTSMSQT